MGFQKDYIKLLGVFVDKTWEGKLLNLLKI